MSPTVTGEITRLGLKSSGLISPMLVSWQQRNQPSLSFLTRNAQIASPYLVGGQVTMRLGHPIIGTCAERNHPRAAEITGAMERKLSIEWSNKYPLKPIATYLQPIEILFQKSQFTGQSFSTIL